MSIEVESRIGQWDDVDRQIAAMTRAQLEEYCMYLHSLVALAANMAGTVCPSGCRHDIDDCRYAGQMSRIADQILNKVGAES